MSDPIISVDDYIDDTVQLENIAAEMDDDNFDNFGPSHDRVMIIPGQGPRDITDSTVEISQRAGQPGPGRCLKIATVVVLTFINLLNYMDRFTIAGRISI